MDFRSSVGNDFAGNSSGTLNVTKPGRENESLNCGHVVANSFLRAVWAPYWQLQKMKGVVSGMYFIPTGIIRESDNCAVSGEFLCETFGLKAVFNEEVSFISRIDLIIDTVSCLKYSRSNDVAFEMLLMCSRL